MKCKKCGGEIDMSVVYLSFPPQYKCKVCGAYTGGTLTEPDTSFNINSIGSTCKCCNGRGVQQNKDGINIRCPECDGTGYWNTLPNNRLLNGDWTCRKEKRLTNYKIGDDLNAIKFGDFPDQLNETIC